MIGHYLLTLSEEQEDRLLTLTFEPIGHLGVNNCARCMVLTAMDRVVGASATGLTPYEDYDTRRDAMFISPGWRYEYACDRFGAERVNAAIRNRILSNRARRVLQSQPVGVSPNEEPAFTRMTTLTKAERSARGYDVTGRTDV